MIMDTWFYASVAVHSQTVDGALMALRRQLGMLR